MYLFQDGLVRMCTEEYTKPTKQVCESTMTRHYTIHYLRSILEFKFFLKLQKYINI